MTPIDLSSLDQIPAVALISGSTRQAAKEAHGSSRDHWFVERQDIHLMPGFNVRIKNASYTQHVRWLADQMKEVGFRVDKSISCYASRDEDGKTRLYVADGHTRLEAYDLATSEGCDLGPIPIAIGKELQNQTIEDLTVGLVTSNSGRELTPLEKAAVLKRLINFRWSEADIAKRLGVTIQQVQNLLILASAPPEIRQMVASEEVSASTAIDAIRRFGGTAVAKLTAAVSHARSEGKGKATGKHLVDPVHRSAKRQAPALWNVAKVIQSDPGFSALSQVVQAQLVELLKSIETAGQKKSQSRKADRGAQKTSTNSQQNLDLP
ncbi:ParB/RepB/Spo0J family partition protein [Hydrogenophaga bisanensis]|uniref:ParB/RepB/Spo0J family partition protein n=1 Tax=Hydrogenophaga bisanensis TaxID=439611 RepID=A0ABW2RE38_9BURK